MRTAAPLPNGRPDLTLRHVLTLMHTTETHHANPIVRALFGLRRLFIYPAIIKTLQRRLNKTTD